MNSDKTILREGGNAVFSTDCNKTGLNNNVIVCVSSGDAILEPHFLETFHSSLIVTYTKRRIVDKYRDVFLNRYIVKNLNFVRPTESNAAYDPLAYVSSYSDITFLAESCHLKMSSICH